MYPPDACPPYVVFEEVSQRWGFPQATKGTVTFILRVISDYKGGHEINKIVHSLGHYMEGTVLEVARQGKGLLKLCNQRIAVSDDGLTREAQLHFQLFVRR